MKNKKVLVVLGALLVFMCLCVVIVGLLSGGDEEAEPTTVAEAPQEEPTEALPPEPTDTPGPTATPGPTDTPLPTSTPTSTRTPKPTSTPEFGTLDHPYPFGYAAEFVQHKVIEFSVEVIDVIRGQPAWDKIYIANMFNDRAEEGFEWQLTQVRIDYFGSDEGPLEVRDNYFTMRSGGRIWDIWSASVCCLEDVNIKEFEDVTLLSGATYEGWLAFQVGIDDPDPLLVFSEEFYFSTAPSEE